MSSWTGETGPRLRPAWRVIWLVGLAAVFLAPAIQTGYWAEDLYQSIMPRGASVVGDRSLFGVASEHVKGTLIGGRFFPLTPALITTVHYVFREAWAYKAFVVATGVLDIFLFYCLASKLGGRRDYGCFAACLTIGLVQYRVAVDPSLGFSAQMQLLIAGLFLSLLALQRHLEGEGWGWLAASVLLYFACTLLYEVSYVLVFLHVCLILRAAGGRGRRLRAALPFFCAVGFCGFQTWMVRWLHPTAAYWHHPSFDPRAIALAVAHQASAGLPLSYFAFDPLGIFPGHGRGGWLGWLFDWQVAQVGLPAFALSFLCLRDRGATAERTSGGIGRGWLCGLGLILFLFPTPMIAISPYHRAAISPGVGWIPVLIEYYGVGLILSAVLWHFVRATAGGGSKAVWKCVVASLLVAALVGMTYRANRQVVRCFNALPGSELHRDAVAVAGGTWHNQRELLQAALGAGLLDEVPERSIVQCAHEYPHWYDAMFGRYFYAAYAGKSLETVPPSAWAGPLAPEAYRVRDVFVGLDSGYVVLSRGGDGPSTSGGLRLYVRHPGLSRRGAGVPFRVTTPGATESGGPPAIAGQDLRAIKSGRDWAVYSLEALEKPVAPESLQVVFDAGRSPRM